MSKDEKTVIALMMAGVFIASINQTILAPALPSIMRSMQINAAQGQWFTTVYLLINGIMVPVTAYLTERFSNRRIYLAAMSLFSLGTALAALSHTFLGLLGARVLQGAAFGVLLPLLVNTMMLIFPPHKRGVAMGYAGMVFAGAPALGPPLAGIIVDRWNWNATFLAVLPFALINVVLALRFLRDIGETAKPHLDLPSVGLSTLGFGGLLAGFSLAGVLGWTAPLTLFLIIGGSGVIVVFTRRQMRLQEPLLRMDVFQNRQFAVGTAVAMLTNGALIAGTIATPIYLQQVLGYNAFKSTLVMFPASLAGMFLSPVVGKVFDRHGLRRIAFFGYGIMIFGTFLYLTFDAESTFLYLTVVYTFRLLGIMIVMGPVNTWSLNGLEKKLIPHGNAVSTTLRQVAGSLGTAGIISIMSLVTMYHASSGFVAATLSGIHAAFAISGAVLVLGFGLIVIGVRDHH